MSSITSHEKKQEKLATYDLERTAIDEDDNSSTSNKHVEKSENLNRQLTPRLINMITLAGVIGTGLFLSTGRALATGGPLSLLLGYMIIGLLVFFVMLALSEMSSLYPVSGSFTQYARRFGSESLGFAVLINYWFNDACSVASDMTAISLVIDYYNDHLKYWYVISIVIWVFLLFLNVIHVRVYAEAEYWLALLKVITIIIFFIVSIICNAGVNPSHEYIGFKYWSYKDAPFVHGFRGFSSVFVSAAFALGGLESISLTAGETKNPTKTIPKTIKTTFTRIIVFYVFTAFFIGMNIPYDYPNLSTKTTATSPFTLVFQQVGAKGGGSYMNTVILLSIISAGNHALYAGSRLAFNLSSQGFIPKIFLPLNRFKIPYVAVIVTWLVGGLCFASAFVGSGELFNWLQSIVGISNLLSWFFIGVTSLRFRRGIELQGRTHELIFKNWTYPLGPWFIIIFGGFVILVQGWSTFSPFSVSDFFQSYLELGVFLICFVFWWLIVKRGKDKFVRAKDMDFDTDKYIQTQEELEEDDYSKTLKGWSKFKYNFADNFL
ncbi:ALP1 [Candida jiufengensis]|uniref:ALP1 n=1 Tax=Candida jiufengensis TaxID=497108 RepID=UPI002224AE27|nr:ALP1 [Candida jiufengensis]KAI5951289.1 ALP1 [Candida jiufengensis]